MELILALWHAMELILALWHAMELILALWHGGDSCLMTCNGVDSCLMAWRWFLPYDMQWSWFLPYGMELILVLWHAMELILALWHGGDFCLMTCNGSWFLFYGMEVILALWHMVNWPSTSICFNPVIFTIVRSHIAIVNYILQPNVICQFYPPPPIVLLQPIHPASTIIYLRRACKQLQTGLTHCDIDLMCVPLELSLKELTHTFLVYYRKFCCVIKKVVILQTWDTHVRLVVCLFRNCCRFEMEACDN